MRNNLQSPLLLSFWGCKWRKDTSSTPLVGGKKLSSRNYFGPKAQHNQELMITKQFLKRVPKYESCQFEDFICENGGSQLKKNSKQKKKRLEPEILIIKHSGRNQKNQSDRIEN